MGVTEEGSEALAMLGACASCRTIGGAAGPYEVGHKRPSLREVRLSPLTPTESLGHPQERSRSAQLGYALDFPLKAGRLGPWSTTYHRGDRGVSLDHRWAASANSDSRQDSGFVSATSCAAVVGSIPRRIRGNRSVRRLPRSHDDRARACVGRKRLSYLGRLGRAPIPRARGAARSSHRGWPSA
jgi:hypothetical protein